MIRIRTGIAFDNVFIPSQLLKAENTIVIAVGIGNIRIVQIYEIASDPDVLFATTVSDFDALEKVVKVISDQIKFCTAVRFALNLNVFVLFRIYKSQQLLMLPISDYFQLCLWQLLNPCSVSKRLQSYRALQIDRQIHALAVKVKSK